MQKGPKPAELRLSEEERNELKGLVQRHSTPQQLAKRGRMIRASAEGKRNAEIARELEVSVDTVRSWRMRWIGLQAVSLKELEVRERLSDIQRPGRPSEITAEQTWKTGGSGLRATERTSDQPTFRDKKLLTK
jgi:putative transposase